MDKKSLTLIYLLGLLHYSNEYKKDIYDNLLVVLTNESLDKNTKNYLIDLFLSNDENNLIILKGTVELILKNNK